MAAVPSVITPAKRASGPAVRPAPRAANEVPASNAVPRQHTIGEAPDTVTGTLPLVQEAAVLFSAGFADAAASLLREEIASVSGRRNRQAWLALFALYEASHQREPFDAIAIKYTLLFEQSPPTWSEGSPSSSAGPSGSPREVARLKPGAGIGAELTRLELAAAQGRGIAIDLSLLAGICAEEAQVLGAALRRLRRCGALASVSGADALRAALQEQTRLAATDLNAKALWDALFEVLILVRDADAFDILGLEYALAFEISPPAWESFEGAAKAPARATPAPARTPTPSEGAEAYALSGPMGAASIRQLNELQVYAAGRAVVAIDCRGVERFDFHDSRHFTDLLRKMNAGGKKLVLKQISEINASTLEALGAGKTATLVRAKTT